MSLRRENGQSRARKEEETINRSGITENRGGGGIFVVLYLAGGDAPHLSGMVEGDGEGGDHWSGAAVLIRSGRDADDRNPSLEKLFCGAEVDFPLRRESIFSFWLLPGRSSPVQPDSQRTLAVHVSNVITFPDLGEANWID